MFKKKTHIELPSHGVLTTAFRWIVSALSVFLCICLASVLSTCVVTWFRYEGVKKYSKLASVRLMFPIEWLYFCGTGRGVIPPNFVGIFCVCAFFCQYSPDQQCMYKDAKITSLCFWNVQPIFHKHSWWASWRLFVDETEVQNACCRKMLERCCKKLNFNMKCHSFQSAFMYKLTCSSGI